MKIINMVLTYLASIPKVQRSRFEYFYLNTSLPFKIEIATIWFNIVHPDPVTLDEWENRASEPVLVATRLLYFCISKSSSLYQYFIINLYNKTSNEI